MVLRPGFVLLIAGATAAGPSLAADITFTPPAGGGVAITNSAGDATRMRIGEDGLVSISGTLGLPASTASVGNITKNGARFIHDFGTSGLFFGTDAGNFTMSGSNNMGLGHGALSAIAAGSWNTGVGGFALAANTTGNNNTATGFEALRANTIGSQNSAFGEKALFMNTTGTNNTAGGMQALRNNTTGVSSIAIGSGALFDNTSGNFNTAVGTQSMNANTTGTENTALGYRALLSSTGTRNIGIGSQAGSFIAAGSNNIAIGSLGSMTDSGVIRIGTNGTHTRLYLAAVRATTTDNNNAIPVLIDSAGQLGVMSSSIRAKEDVADMDGATEALMRLRPVTFHYKSHGPTSRLQYGLIAEEVERVYPGLVTKNADGTAETVMYQFLPPMLLNELQKQQRRIEAQAEEIAELKRMLKALTAAR